MGSILPGLLGIKTLPIVGKAIKAKCFMRWDRSTMFNASFRKVSTYSDFTTTTTTIQDAEEGYQTYVVGSIWGASEAAMESGWLRWEVDPTWYLFLVSTIVDFGGSWVGQLSFYFHTGPYSSNFPTWLQSIAASPPITSHCSSN